MGLTKTRSTIPGGYTPICNQCGISLCWDISEEEGDCARVFWDEWVCADCNGGVALSLNTWKESLVRGTPAS